MASKYARRHYEDTAKVAKDTLDYLSKNGPLDMGDEYVVELILGRMVEVFQKDNPAFDADRFKKACGL